MNKVSNKRKAHRILAIECAGFATIILLSWSDELFGLPHLLFGGPSAPNWRESAWESLVTLAVWLVVVVMTKQLLRKFNYLEEMLTMCGWCRKLERAGEWVSFEQYCEKELGLDTSHSICPKCGRQMLGDAPAAASAQNPAA